MPRRRDNGRRQRDALVAAALRNLDTGGKSSPGTPPPTSFLDDETASGVRASRYHSYRLTRSRGGGRYQQRGVLPATSEDNGNLFQDTFSVNRENPAYFWQEA